MRLENTFEGGIPGQAITEANSGGASGDALLPVFPFTDGPLYSSLTAAHGNISCEFEDGAYTGVKWESLSISDGDLYARVNIRIDSSSLYSMIWVALEMANENSWQFFAGMTEDGPSAEIQYYDSANDMFHLIDTFPVVPAMNQWVRLEMRASNAASGTAEGRLYNDLDSVTPSGSVSGGFTQSLSPWSTIALYGQSYGSSAYVDDLAASNEGWIGPAGVTPSPRFRGWGVPI